MFSEFENYQFLALELDRKRKNKYKHGGEVLRNTRGKQRFPVE